MSGLGGASEPLVATSGESGAAPFEVIDALGWFRLHRRTADLDGSVPLRAARACLPLLEGNAQGWQLSARVPLALRRRLGGWQVADAELVRVARACVPFLAAHGFVRGRWGELLAEGPLLSGRAFGGYALWTGLLVRAGAGVVRVSHAGNRRNRDLAVGESFIHETTNWVPLVLELSPTTHGQSIIIGQEVATVTAVCGLPIATAGLGEHPELGAAHLQFFDASYFEDKRNGPTKKYRQLGASDRDAPDPARLLVVRAGPDACAIETEGRRHDADGPRTGPTVPRLLVRNLVGFSAREDGSTVHIDPDPRALASLARAIESTWSQVFDQATLEHARGALWYLTKYFTPHVTGEPHFFVKPPALLVTPPGTSLLIDGIHGQGYDVLRGVVRCDRFHACPAVFAVDRGATIALPEGTPLCRLLPLSPALDRIAPRVLDPLPTASS